MKAMILETPASMREQPALLDLSYHEHLWMEREIKTVANLEFRDIQEFLPLAAEIGIRPQVNEFPLENANQALQELRRGGVTGANVLACSPNSGTARS